MFKRKLILGVAFALTVALAAIGGAQTTHAAAVTTTTTSVIPVAPASFYVPCGNGGVGEWVTFSGSLHLTESTTIDANGGFHYVWIVNPMGVTGVGEDSGDVFNGVGCTRQTVYVAPDAMPLTATYVDSFGVIGRGQAPNLFIKTIDRFTIDANGNVATAILFTEVTCR